MEIRRKILIFAGQNLDALGMFLRILLSGASSRVIHNHILYSYYSFNLKINIMYMIGC